MNEYRLSICISEYNRGKMIFQSVSSILSCKDKRFQVSFFDNGSSDDTIRLLETINDVRLKRIHSEKNLGAKLGWMNALDAGDGDWLYLAMGRDQLNPEKITKLIQALDVLDQNNICLAKDAKIFDEEIKIFHEAAGAIDFFLSMSAHPTGIIFRKKEYRNIECRKEYFSMNDFTYPEAYIMRDMLYNKNWGAVLNGFIFEGKTNLDLKKEKSRFEECEPKIKYYYPQKRWNECWHFIDMIEQSEMGLSRSELDDRFIFLYNQLLDLVSRQWFFYQNDETWTAHYNEVPRIVTKREMIFNIFEARKRMLERYTACSLKRRVKMEYWTVNNVLRILKRVREE